MLGRAPGSCCGPGIPLGLGKGGSDWQIPPVTSGPLDAPSPKARGGRSRQGRGLGPVGFGVFPQPEPAAERRRRNSPRTDFFLVPNPLQPTPPPPAPLERQLLEWQMHRLNPPSWSFHRANSLESMVCVGGRGGRVGLCVRHRPYPSLTLPFDPCLFTGERGLVSWVGFQVQTPFWRSWRIWV